MAAGLAVLGDEWVAEAAAALTGADLAAPGLTGELALVVPPTAGRPRRGAPAGDAARLAAAVEDGRVVAVWAGAPGSEPLVNFTLPLPDLVEAVTAGTEPSVLFMQGRLKVDGDPRVALAVLAATAGERYRAGRGRLGDATAS